MPRPPRTKFYTKRLQFISFLLGIVCFPIRGNPTPHPSIHFLPLSPSVASPVDTDLTLSSERPTRDLISNIDNGHASNTVQPSGMHSKLNNEIGGMDVAGTSNWIEKSLPAKAPSSFVRFSTGQEREQTVHPNGGPEVRRDTPGIQKNSHPTMNIPIIWSFGPSRGNENYYQPILRTFPPPTGTEVLNPKPVKRKTTAWEFDQSPAPGPSNTNRPLPAYLHHEQGPPNFERIVVEAVENPQHIDFLNSRNFYDPSIGNPTSHMSPEHSDRESVTTTPPPLYKKKGPKRQKNKSDQPPKYLFSSTNGASEYGPGLKGGNKEEN